MYEFLIYTTIIISVLGLGFIIYSRFKKKSPKIITFLPSMVFLIIFIYYTFDIVIYYLSGDAAVCHTNLECMDEYTGPIIMLLGFFFFMALLSFLIALFATSNRRIA